MDFELQIKKEGWRTIALYQMWKPIIYCHLSCLHRKIFPEIFYDVNNSDDSKLWASTFGRGLWSSNLPSLFATQNPSSFNVNALSQNQIDLTSKVYLILT